MTSGKLLYFTPVERYHQSDVGTCQRELLASLVGLELLEVVDKHLGEFLSLVVPFFGVGISVAGVEDAGVDAGQLSGDYEIEVGEHFCGSLLDVAVEDIVDDAASVGD